MHKVMVFGTFDLLHEGHKNLFKQAKQQGDYLIVVVATEKNTFAIKGRAPIHSETERLEALKKEPGVDIAVLGDGSDPYKVITEHKPDLICLGYDQHNCFEKRLTSKLKEYKLNIPVMRLNPHQPEKYKSSILRKELEARR